MFQQCCILKGTRPYTVKKFVKLAHMRDCTLARMLRVIVHTWHMNKQTVSNLRESKVLVKVTRTHQFHVNYLLFAYITCMPGHVACASMQYQTHELIKQTFLRVFISLVPLRKQHCQNIGQDSFEQRQFYNFQIKIK